MRRYRKKQILEKFHILYEAHQCIGQMMAENQEIISMLANCQEMAIEIGTEIEASVRDFEGGQIEGTPESECVNLLSSYCELLFQITERKYPMSPVVMAEVTKSELNEKLKLAEKVFREKVSEQREIVFFPYKASMWDSMETLWKKLQQEENTHCTVVPLPYYIKNENRKKVKSCYEGKDFPADVPIIHYEQFLKKEFYADIAIYHNPYDDANKITEVDKRFFTSKLHKYADTLVYIPYFVFMEKPEVAYMITPGVKNADYVILQDEEVQEAFQQWYPRQKEKFLVGTSPKIEKAIQMSKIPRNELDIPEAWKKKIEGKKVLFYNTHLISFMSENIDFISKLKFVFETMRHQDEVVLWWRPHPLSGEMKYSISEKWFQAYAELVEWYKKEDFGIYDDTPKLHEAIAAADAYYGDKSSLVKLFQVVGKPILIQDIGITESIFD